MKVLSLFDGMSCGQIALDQLGIKHDYFASEIDKYAIKVTQQNYPDTTQVGDVTQLSLDCDLLLAGSPCQGFSFAGKQLNFEDERSKLFFEFLRIKEESKPEFFLLENVRMKKEWQNVISEKLGVHPIEINSSMVSGQSRRRLYWTNIPVKPPSNRGINFESCLEENVDRKYYVSEIQNKRLNPGNLTKCGGICFSLPGVEMEHSPCLMARDYKGISGKQLFPIAMEKDGLRKLTPIEYERLQTVPDNYTAAVSNTQRYKMLGNGWTVGIIKHILEGIR